jgi:hypothetical protein
MNIARRTFRRKAAAVFLIAAVCSLCASAVYGSGTFTFVPLGSPQFHFAPITWASIATSTPARSKSHAATTTKAAPLAKKAAPTPLSGEVLGASISPTDTVTHSELTASLDELSNSLKQIVYSNLSAPNSLPATGGCTNSIALSNRIDQLSGTKLTNITVSGVAGLTAADIPTGITAANYLPLAGGALTGTLSGTNLTLSGNLTVAGAQTLSGAITIPYLTATSTTAVSSFQQLLANGSTTLQNFTFVNATGAAATTTALFATLGHFTTGIIDTLTSALANFGTITATNATFTNSTTTNEYSSNLAAAAARFGATATSSFSSAGALTLASPLAVSFGGTGSTTLSGILKGAGTSQVATAIAGTDYQAPLSFSYPIQNSSNVVSLAFGTTTANTWSSLQTLASGFLSVASSTIGSGAQAGGFTINGGATTTGNAYSMGNVGIGTTTSSALLALDSASPQGTILRIGNGSVGGHVWDFLETGSGNTDGSGRLDFFDKTAGLARLSIAANGNVGVGTTSPFATLAVVGSGYFSGTLQASQVLQNTEKVASERSAYRDLVFYDDFNRADTAVGSLGTSTSGAAYDMRGLSAQSNNAVTQITNGEWVSSPGDVTYAIQTLPRSVTDMGARISWAPGNGGGSPGAFSMIISPDKTGSNLYKNAAAHIIITRTSWTIEYITMACARFG